MTRAATMGLSIAAMLLAPSAMGQSQNAGQTGVGEAVQSLEALQQEVAKQWDGRPGQVVKGAATLAGMAAALSAANRALTFQLRVRGDGSVDQSGVAGTTSTTTVDTSTSTSTSTSTN